MFRVGVRVYPATGKLDTCTIAFFNMYLPVYVICTHEYGTIISRQTDPDFEFGREY